eukprot:comp22770_c1_seq1/m.35607 comp22770_c1_seq1/g.35607  ORF comp22770_c1_seq1/g.35607 comp22770_c1_seq1/m.35607 type:complete len:346 (-) comp22770_c1_seq1:44-1081(-)
MSVQEETKYMDIPEIEKLKGDPGTPFLQAAREGNLVKMKELFMRGYSVDDRHQKGDVKGMTALHWTAGDGRLPETQWLLENGADITAKDDWGQTPLQQACYNGHTEVVKFLVEKGADIHEKDKTWGQNALHWAAVKGTPDLIKYLVEKGMDVNMPDGDKNQTPVYLCVKAGNVECVEYLLKMGGRTDVADKDGQTPETVGKNSPEEKIRNIFTKLQKTKAEREAKAKKEEAKRKKELGKLYLEGPINEWQPEKVQRFLELNGLEHYVDAFKAKSVDGSRLVAEGKTLVDSNAQGVLTEALTTAQQKYTDFQSKIASQQQFETVLNGGSALLLAIVLANVIRRLAA